MRRLPRNQPRGSYTYSAPTGPWPVREIKLAWRYRHDPRRYLFHKLKKLGFAKLALKITS